VITPRRAATAGRGSSAGKNQIPGYGRDVKLPHSGDELDSAKKKRRE
jgi:hypothetical protein